MAMLTEQSSRYLLKLSVRLCQVSFHWPLRRKHIIDSLCLFMCICSLTACWPEAATVVFVTTTATTKRPDAAAVFVVLVIAFGILDSCHESITGRSWLTPGTRGGFSAPSSPTFYTGSAPSAGNVASSPIEQANQNVLDMSIVPDLAEMLDLTNVVPQEDLSQSVPDSSEHDLSVEPNFGGVKLDDSIEHGAGNAKFDDSIEHGAGNAKFDDSIEHGAGNVKFDSINRSETGDSTR